MTETHLHPSRSQLDALGALDPDSPIVMINFLKFAPEGGAEQYRTYGEAAGPFLADAGASLRYIGDMNTVVIGPDAEDWDEVILVNYPSIAAFIAMTTADGYPADLRAGALLDSRLWCSIPYGSGG